MAKCLESLKDMVPEANGHDILREGMICFLVKNTIIPVRLFSPPPSSFGKKDAYYYVFYS